VGDTSLLRICIDDSRAVRNPTGQWLCLGCVAEGQELRFPSELVASRLLTSGFDSREACG
jgi:hypothetical protein